MLNAMVRRFVPGALVLAVALPAAALAQPRGAQTAGVTTATKPECRHAIVAMDVDVDSARVHAGDPFTFRIESDATAPDGTPIPAGTLGHGTVQVAQHAQRGGRGGYLVLDARFLALANGTHVPVTIDPVRGTNAVATGGSGNIPGVVNALPFVGYVTGPYGFIHHGKDATIQRGTRLAVIIGDDAALGTCRIPAANEPVPPPASEVPAPQPAGTQSPAPQAPAAQPSVPQAPRPSASP
jgi:hypothetical protein